MREYNLKNIAFHPFMIGLYPVLALLGHNITEVRVSDATRSMVFMLIAVSILVVVLRVIFRSWRRAALAASFMVIVFLTYGYLYDVIQQNNPELPIGRHRFLIPLYFVIVVSGLWGIKKIQDLDTATQVVNLVGLVAIIFPLYQIISHGIITSYVMYSKKAEAANHEGLTVADDFTYPDIYYIILDGYPRADILQEVYDFDNSMFLDQLRDLGFYIVECSQSNYSKTSQALPSTLNLNYLDVLAGGNIRNFYNPATWISFSEVNKNLDSLEYTTVAFSTGYPDTEMTDADVFLQLDEVNMDDFEAASILNGFEAMLIETSGLVFADALTVLDLDILPTSERLRIHTLVGIDPHKQRYAQIAHAFTELDNITSFPSPKFVFAHIIAPHEPFLFAADGTFSPEQGNDRDAYINQLTFVNQRIIPILTEIIKSSDTPPIIIVQGDHGPAKLEYTPLRVMNLGALYLPYGGDQKLYSTITPVNYFRLIFDYYFGENYGLLEDVSYNSKSKEDLFDHEIVPNLCDQ